MQKIFIIILFLIFNNTFILSVFANEMPTHVRVGLEERYKEVDRVEISNKHISVGYNQQNKFYSQLNFKSDSGFTVKFADNSFVKVGEFTSINEAINMKNYVDLLDFKSSIAIINDGVYSIFISETDNQTDIQTIANIVGGIILAPANNFIVLLDDTKKTVVVLDNSMFLQISPLDGEFIILNDRLYRGILEVGQYGNDRFTAVNILSVNEYLYSVVPAEMPSSWQMEALKAQAVLARNYVWQRSLVGIHNGYDLCDTIHCQRYLGATVESLTSTEAVNQTENVRITYNGSAIEAVYFSSSGGFTSNSEDVWSEKLDYLRAVEDVYENEYREWVRTFSLDELTDIAMKKNINIGNVVGLSITQYDALGRVNELTLNGMNGRFSLQKENIRNFFDISNGGSLYSRNFVILDGDIHNINNQIIVTNGEITLQLDVKDINVIGEHNNNLNEIFTVGNGTAKKYSSQSINLSSGNEVVISGKGWGHGVGMSQHGAKGMAEAGFSFYEILKFYFVGVDIS